MDQVRGEVSDKNELQNGGGEETNLQAGNNEECKVREQKGYEMQTRDEENEKKSFPSWSAGRWQQGKRRNVLKW